MESTDKQTDSKKFRFRLDRRAKIITSLALLLLAAGVAYLVYESSGSYLPAWFLTLAVALILLAVLSIPRFVLVSPHSVEIHCTMELVKIPIRDIKSIRAVEKSEMRFCFPLWGVYGIFGYYGYYFNLKKKKGAKMYASKWKNFVLIEDIYEDFYVISSDDPQEFIAQIDKFR